MLTDANTITLQQQNKNDNKTKFQKPKKNRKLNHTEWSK
jgi:hypothetical protein